MLKDNYIYLIIIASLITLVIGIKIEFFTTYEIKWSSTNKITWEEFRPVEYLPDSTAAIIYTSVKSDVKKKNKKALIYAYMDTEKSKRVDISKLSNAILKHEQYHFNIAEYYARVLRKELVALGEKKFDNEHIKDIALRIEQELNNQQDLYDKQTRHGASLIEQPLWEIKVDSLLKSLERYKDINLYSYSAFNNN